MEWNEGAIFLIFAMFLVPVLIVYFILKRTMRYFPSGQSFIDKSKSEGLAYKFFIELGLLIISALLTYGMLSLIVFFKGEGLLE
ncbi:hypothetical protein [Pontibacter akesuensis]|nr:hypothetical protein [Pontibacter akesuensis]GHA78267.1 hypothetical protein GCM10007389_35360 [Pontibacter akesuensis]